MSSLGNDLASIRKSKQISLEEVQATTKIPLSTLKSIEDGTLFDDASQQHQTYVRSFVRSFGKALKVSDDVLVNALNSYEKGTYTDELLGHNEPKPSSAPLFELESSPTHEEPTEDSVEAQEQENTGTLEKKKDYHVSPAPPTVDSVNWADMGKKFGVAEVKSRTWILVVSILLIISVAVILFFFGGDILSKFTSDSSTATIELPTQVAPTLPPANDPETESTQAITDNSLATAPDSDPILSTPAPLDQLGDTLSLVVYAAFDILEPVRVTSDITWRTNPYWIEQTSAYSFAFQDTILVRGQYTRMLLMINGHVIENARQLYFDDEYDSIMITRSVLENNSTFLQPPPLDFPYSVGAPTEIINP